MCMQCVAQSLPYVGLAVGGLRLAAWRGRRTRLTTAGPDAAPPPVTADARQPGTADAPVDVTRRP